MVGMILSAPTARESMFERVQNMERQSRAGQGRAPHRLLLSLIAKERPRVELRHSMETDGDQE